VRWYSIVELNRLVRASEDRHGVNPGNSFSPTLSTPMYSLVLCLDLGMLVNVLDSTYLSK